MLNRENREDRELKIKRKYFYLKLNISFLAFKHFCIQLDI
jgi:hypothetical protein